MNNESSEDRQMRELWQSQKTEGVRMSVEQIRLSAGKFQRRIEWRNARESIGAFAAAAFFAFEFALTNDLLMRIGFGLLIAAAFYMVWQLYTRGSWRRLPEDAGLSSCIEFQRRELKRQRDFLRGVWRWYLGPIIPGLVVTIAAVARSNPHRLKHSEALLGLYVVFIAAGFWFVAWLNKRAARRLQCRIDQLDDLARQG